ncbi:MAG: SpoIIIAH-like family protein [Syntrophomonas sp.]
MNKMIILNSTPKAINKKKITLAFGIVALFLLVVKILGAVYHEESPQPVKAITTHKEAEVQTGKQIKTDDNQKEESFFAGFRMERERVRGKQIEVLNEVINNQENVPQAQVVAANRLVKITEDMDAEMKSEQILKSKGYQDCVVIMQKGTVTAVIKSAPLVIEEKTELKEMLGRLAECKSAAVSIIVNSGE